MKATHIALLTAVTGLSLAGCDLFSSYDKESGAVLAKVNGKPVKESALERHFSDIPAEAIAGQEDAIKRQILERLIEQEIIKQEMKKLGLNEDPEYRKQKKLLIGQLQYQMVLNHKLKEAVTDEKIQARYEETKEQRAYPAIRASHILVKDEAEAKKLARKATPENFAELAKENSLGPTSTQGGDLGWFSKDAMVPAFAEVAFATDTGKVAKNPVQTQFGWHVVYVADRNDAFVPPLTPQLESVIRNELNQQVAAAYLAELKNTAEVTYTDAAPTVGDASTTDADAAAE